MPALKGDYLHNKTRDEFMNPFPTSTTALLKFWKQIISFNTYNMYNASNYLSMWE